MLSRRLFTTILLFVSSIRMNGEKICLCCRAASPNAAGLFVLDCSPGVKIGPSECGGNRRSRPTARIHFVRASRFFCLVPAAEISIFLVGCYCSASFGAVMSCRVRRRSASSRPGISSSAAASLRGRPFSGSSPGMSSHKDRSRCILYHLKASRFRPLRRL